MARDATTRYRRGPKMNGRSTVTSTILQVGLVLAAALALGSLPAVGEEPSRADDRLTTSLLDPLVPGETARLAVSWKGVEAAFLTVELSGETVAMQQIEPGMRVLEIDVPWGAELGELRLRAEGWDGVTTATAGGGSCAWSPGEPANGVDSSVSALAVYDDGDGAALYVGGDFGISRWDGDDWSSLGTGIEDDVEALAVWDDGGGAALYAGGQFDEAGGTPANYVAKWDGTSWSALGSGVDDSVEALAVYDSGGGARLHAGGYFTTAGGAAASRVASWNGSSWSAVGSGADALVSALAVFDDGGGASLYAGGDFDEASGTAASHVAEWDGSGWSPLGSGLDSNVSAFTVWDDGGGEALYVGGGFSTVGGAPAHRVAKWDGSTWSALGSGLCCGGVLALAVWDDGGGEALYAGGSFGIPGTLGAQTIAKWDGSTWSALGSGMDGFSVRALAVYDDGGAEELYAGGDFTTAGGTPASRIAKWDGGTWSALGGGIDTSFGIIALTVHDDGTGEALYAGGEFTTAGGTPASNVAKWDGSTWSALGSGMNSYVQALTPYDAGGGAALYVGGDFTTAGGMSSAYFAAWSCATGLIFSDGFESGSTTGWSGSAE